MSVMPESLPSSTEPTPAVSRPFPDLSWIFIVLAAGLMIGSILGSSYIAYSPNDASRWDTVYSLVTHGAYYYVDDPVHWRAVPREQVTRPIDFPPLPTIDMVRIGDKFYSSKPALLPTCIAGLVWCISALTGKTFADDPYFIVKTTLILMQVIPMVVLLLLLRWHFRRWLASPFVYHFCMASAALGTYLTSWSVTLNNHVPAACAVMVAVHALLRIWRDGRREGYWFILAGFFSTLAAALDLPAALLAAILFVVLAAIDLRRTLVLALPPALIVVAAALYTNYLAFGTVAPAYFTFGKPGGPYDYEGSYWNQPVGIDQVKENRLVYLMHMLIGHHGVFLLTPIFLLSFWGMLIELTARGRSALERTDVSRGPSGSETAAVAARGPNRLFALLALLTTAIIVAFYATNKTQNYGGACQGLRWMFWLIPLWLWFLPIGVARLAGGRPGCFVCYLFLLVSIANGLAAISQPWTFSWAQQACRHLGWINY